MTATGLVEALHVAGPAGPDAERLRLFGQFIGSWEIAWTGLDAEGRTETARGELHFGWVLGGRAVQDIWIVPGRCEPGESRPPLAFHGSTIRFYDAALGAWRSTWIDPVNGRVRRFVGRPDGDDIVLLSDEDDPQLRWRFTDIRPDSFVCRARSRTTAARPGRATKRCASHAPARHDDDGEPELRSARPWAVLARREHALPRGLRARGAGARAVRSHALGLLRRTTARASRGSA